MSNEGQSSNFAQRVAPSSNDFTSPETQQSRSRLPGMQQNGADFTESHDNVTPNVGPSKKPLFGKSTVVKTVSASKPSMFNSGSKPGGAGGLFKKPGMMGLGKKKFQLDVAAPSETEV